MLAVLSNGNFYFVEVVFGSIDAKLGNPNNTLALCPVVPLRKLHDLYF